MLVSRPQSGRHVQDSFMSDANLDASHRIGNQDIMYAEEEAKRIGVQVSEHMESSFMSSATSDMSGETYSKEDSEEHSVSFSSDSSEEPDLSDQPVRVYDARFKIPAQSNIGQLMSAKNSNDLTKGQTSKQYRDMVKRLERYKKFVSTMAIVLMGAAMIFNIVVYGFKIVSLQKEPYFIARTRFEVQKEIDFEQIKVTEIKYFLYKNQTAGAMDAGDDLNLFTVENIDTLCDDSGYYLDSDSARLTGLRDNISSPFMLVSEAYILLLMAVTMIFATIIIPQKMKEHHVPMLMRQADENMFHVMMRVRCFVFLFYITLSGCLCHLTNYFADTCLHTELKPILFTQFDVNMTDYYQFCMVSLIWFISIPVSCFLIGAYFKDATRYSMIPCMITSLVFIVFALVLSIFTITNMLLNGNSYFVVATQCANLFVYFFVQMLNFIYLVKYSKKDLLRTEEEEIDV